MVENAGQWVQHNQTDFFETVEAILAELSP
jgi:hypothetical protein